MLKLSTTKNFNISFSFVKIVLTKFVAKLKTGTLRCCIFSYDYETS